MKKQFLLLVLLQLMFTIVSAQIDKKILASAIYNVSYTKNNIEYIRDQCELNIANSKSYFFSLNKIQNYKQLQQKIENAMQTNSPLNLNASDSKLLTNYVPFSILKNYTTKKVIILEEINGQTFGYLKDTAIYKNWHLLNDTIRIQNLLCHKAKYTQDSLSVTAWYCTELPFQDGPLSYSGLPGLILKAENSNGWKAEINSIVYNNDKKEIDIPLYTIITEEAFIKAKKANREALLNNMQSQDGNVKMKIEPKSK
jgi:Protein of unknown function (Porph_ging).